MKTAFVFLAAGLFIPTTVALAAGPTIPQRQSPDAYRKMTEDWPFALATPPVAVVKAADGWWTNYYVGGIGKNMVDGKEEIFVAVKPKNGEASFSLYGAQENADGISVAGIEWSELAGKSRVTLKKGQESGTIEFDQAPSQVAAPPNVPRPGMPNLPGVRQQPMIRPPGAAGAVVPRPTNIPQPVPQAAAGVPLPGGPSNTNAPASPSNINGGQNQPNAPKQRVRVIKSTP